ncbi:HNH endonuclease [Micromonospora sp. Llam7]|uniref:HNH endonuclease n=1 Tax=Micromonospora tarapacensis TaxID=2835305 RepID=UPI001C8305B2|nr:HNH endonuclease [Micromonospora tarapacensis]MBX7264775.1 HNH endonuclease [Micromonospora tarapacensis]
MARPCSKRMRRIKRGLAARDGAQCFYCGLPFLTLLAATVDHLIPQSLLPGWAQINLVLACRPCNQRKSGQLPQVFLRTAGLVPPLRQPTRSRLAVLLASLAARLAQVAQMHRRMTTPVVTTCR